VPGKKSIDWIQSDCQVDFYDKPHLVTPAADRLAQHLRKHLGKRRNQSTSRKIAARFPQLDRLLSYHPDRVSCQRGVMAAKDRSGETEQHGLIAAQLDDARSVVIYLVAPESVQYIAIMEILEGSITDLTPEEVAAHLHAQDINLDSNIIQTRLDKLREWGSVSARTDASRILRYSDLLARNWRYTATPMGRQVQRFYRKVLAGTPAVREIPLSSLARVVEAAESLVSTAPSNALVPELIGRLFVNHDDLDAALVGAEDSLATLADRFDLSDESTAELKSLLVGYATHVATELDHGSSRVHRALCALAGRFIELAQATVRASDARLLIERGALSASHGGRVEDWQALQAWFDPTFGRAARFGLRLVRALPGMHVNLRRLHSSSGTATSRSRALALAKACANPTYGPAILRAALGDHPWRKLYGEADDGDLVRLRSWRDAPHVAVPELLRSTGRAGARGRVPAARDDTRAREHVRAAREHRAAEHAAAVREVLAAGAGDCLSARAARVALASLLAAAHARSANGRRSAVRDGLGCTLFDSGPMTGVLAAPTWRVSTPGRIPIFHLPHVAPARPPHVTPPAEAAKSTAPPRVLLDWKASP
jgi:uncharacterized protein (TIGR02677 family)